MRIGCDGRPQVSFRGGVAARGQGGGGGSRTTWTLTSRPPGPDPRDIAAYVVDTIAVSYHGNNTTHLDAPSHLYYKGQIYNGYPQTSYTDRGAGKDDAMIFRNGILTRGVLFDIPKLLKGPSVTHPSDPWFKRQSSNPPPQHGEAHAHVGEGDPAPVPRGP